MFVGSVVLDREAPMITPNEKLQRARLEKRWSVSTASRRVGVSTNTLNRWERGLQVPQLATLDQLMEAFEMSAEDLGFGFVISPQKRTESEVVSEENLEGDPIVSPSSMQAAGMVRRAPGMTCSIKSSRPPHS